MTTATSNDQFLAQLLDDLKSNRLVLPTLPEVALRVRDKVEDPNASAGQIADIVATDPALAARLFQIANSPLYRGTKPIDDLKMAITRLGLGVVRNVVTSLAMQQIFQPTSDALDSRLRAIWEHSTEVAAISSVLAKQYTRLRPDEAMLAGLVHEIGALPILSRAEEDPALVEDESRLDALLEEASGTIGQEILKAWGFPDTMVAVPAGVRDLGRDSGGKPDYTDVVQVAKLQALMGTDHPLAQADWSTVPAFAKLGIACDVEEIDIGMPPEEVDAVRDLLQG
ncbi:MAG: HDOD domain-containing protein [Gammaproteobacteria bacterium]